MIGLLLFGGMALLLAIGVPISFTLGGAVLATILFAPGFTVSPGIIPQRLFSGLESSSIMAIAFFVLAGNIMTKGGISRRIVDFANSIIGNVRGGMSIALVLACAFFAALSGSAPATVVAIGVMLYDNMVRIGYPKERVAGLLVVAGGLGPIIPPSIIMIVYGTITGASISDMFKSGMFIGILIMISLIVACGIYANKEKWPKNDKVLDTGEILKSFWKAIPALLLPVIILGGIYSGIMTPTESASVAVAWSLIASLFIYRELAVKDLWDIFLDSAKGSAMVLFIVATSTAFSWIFAYSGIAGDLVNAIKAMQLSPMLFCVIIAIILLIFGTVLEGIATCVLLVPILWPMAKALGINNIHFGMIVCIANVVGTMTPPVAVNIFAAASVSKLDIGKIVKGQIPFFISYVAIYWLVVLFPALSTFFLSK